MSRGKTGLDSYEYDDYLARNKKERELMDRRQARRNANKGYEGYHFGIADRPIYTRNKDEFKKALSDRGLVMRDDVHRKLR